MAEQLLASLTSSTMASVEWCKVRCVQKLTFLFGSLVGLLSLVEEGYWCGAFFSGWTRPLTLVKGNLYALAYQDILDSALLPTLWVQFGEHPFLFQHDCALKHNTRSIKTLLDKFGVEELDWPTQSPDLNPIQHILEWIF